MKPILFLLSIIVLILILDVSNLQSQLTYYKSKQQVDLPEEYECIASRNKYKPDTLLGFYDNNIVYIQFKTK